MPRIAIHPEVTDALHRNAPLVALETAVVTTGLPPEPLPHWPAPNCNSGNPVNLEIALHMQQLIRASGAVPATVALLDGVLHIGLDDSHLHRLASDVHDKVSVSGLAALMAEKRSAGTTVSATLAACRLTPKPIRVFATGGIGGVHRQWTKTPDISADLRQLAITPTCIVSAGAKSILDLPATLEALEALGVPLITYRTNRFPQFLSRGTAQLPSSHVMHDVATIARACALHWNQLKCSSGLLLGNPVPEQYALSIDELEQVTQAAEQLATQKGITGAQRTPFLLSQVVKATNNRSLQANLALLANNAQLAAELACAISCV